MRRFSALIVTLSTLFILTTPVVFAQDPDNGKIIWEEQVWQCQQCHGSEGQGLLARPLSNSNLTAQEWIDQVRGAGRFMPSFSETQVSDEQIIDIRAYITSLPAPVDFTPSQPDEFANEGQNLLGQKRCVACHDPNTGPLDGFIERGETPTAAAVITQLRTPRNFMPSFNANQVSDDEATLIANFLAEQFALQASPPANLPQSGSSNPTTLPLILSLTGGLLVLVGLALRQRTAKN